MVGHFRGKVSHRLGHLLECWVLDFGDFYPPPRMGALPHSSEGETEALGLVRSSWVLCWSVAASWAGGRNV